MSAPIPHPPHNTPRLNALVDSLDRARVLVLGDVMLDRFVRGKVARISPEAPVPVLRNAQEKVMLGGAGNVVRNITALGGRVVLAGVIGDDAPGQRVRALLAQEERVTAALVEAPGRVTSEKTRFIADGHHLLRSDWDADTPIAADVLAVLLDTVRRHLADVDVVVLSDYGKGVLTPAMLTPVIAAANAAGKPVIVDPKTSDFSRYRGAFLVTPNRSELALAAGGDPRDTAEIVAAARTLIARHGIGALLVTRSEEGMTLVPDERSEPLHVPAEAKEVYDVSGAGDTVVAVLAAAVCVGADLASAARLANIAAGLVVAKVGTAVVLPGELNHALNDQDERRLTDKILNWSDLRARVAHWRAAGLKVGFTNGCFDLVHPGHVHLLAGARATCDRLVVGLNADASVKRLKGPQRPIQDELSRATVLAALASVDAVTLFEQDTPLELITALLPDVLIKGADYTVDQVVGADVVQAAGGRVALIDLVPQQSTTRIAGRIRDGG